ncbi:glycoside hydrolase family 32 protein [Aquibacillus albus]|uniref:Sucrose-6-phosphate hydrolase n=1 Tax=Aquibacillus albus TaxID=1168171 RepID=A0ABS2MW77_9BACI|nr:glycoside hydrolase family 32 protein [Aquibacillus albus]MBM7570148.1 beta-fructofuranosidase [Aquibacillus albus]
MKAFSEQEVIQQAMDSVLKASARVEKCPHRLGYHFMAPAFWINDPNGFIQFDGEYHLFYQHHPYSADWGPMHWGHAKSKDLVYWEHLPIALAPKANEGCFSGSAVDDNGIFTLIYTEHDSNRSPRQVQCLATSEDGINFEKYIKNPVISGPPPGESDDFRDPKVWKYEDLWYMVIGSGIDGKGKVLLYKSEDLKNWKYVGVVLESDGSQGYMWECPDLFPLEEDKFVLIVSPMGMAEVGRKNIYFIGDFNYETGKFIPESSGELDYGFDFYAAQTLLDDKGRRIVIGWMDMWGATMPSKENGWAGAMSLPREISLHPDGKLTFKPIPELKKLRKKQNQFKDIILDNNSNRFLEDIKGGGLEVIVDIDLSRTSSTMFGMILRASDNQLEQTRVIFNQKTKELTVNRNKSGKGDGGIYGHTLEGCLEKNLKLHIFVDRSSVEIFANDGQVVMSNRIYPDPTSINLDFFKTYGEVYVTTLDVWELSSVWG